MKFMKIGLISSILFGGLICQAAGISVTRSCSLWDKLFGNCKDGGKLNVQVEPSSSSLYLQQSGNGLFMATGEAAKILSRNSTPKEVLPAQPAMIALFREQILVGGLTQLPGVQAFIASRHLFSEHPIEWILDGLAQTGIAVEKMKVLGFKTGAGEVLDVLIIHGQDELLPENFHSLVRRKAKLGSPALSFQWGYLEGQPNFEQLSRAVISRLGDHHLYISLGPEQLANYKSSGSLVYSKSLGSDWHPVGITECYIANQNMKNNIQVPGAIRVISLEAVAKAEAYLVDPLELSQESYPMGSCIPIDGRSAGGL